MNNVELPHREALIDNNVGDLSNVNFALQPGPMLVLFPYFTVIPS